jgi:hypothetical protein
MSSADPAIPGEGRVFKLRSSSAFGGGSSPTAYASQHADALLCGSPSPGWACASGKQQ